jgi:hypothetical protein
MEKQHLEFIQAATECERALKITSNMLARANLHLHKANAAIRESEAKIAKSRLVLKGLYGRTD